LLAVAEPYKRLTKSQNQHKRDTFRSMNYLAHALLSGGNSSILKGNMMGDAIKGYKFLDIYSKPVCDGIILHRFIDEYMDTHPLTKSGKKRIWHNYRHYAGVVMDMYYDHLLAKNWHRYSDLELQVFADNIYAILSSDWQLYPEETQQMFRHMIDHNWLGNYISIDGIDRAFKGMSRRTKFVSNMEKAVADLYLYYDDFEAEFLSFFDDISDKCAQKVNDLPHG